MYYDISTETSSPGEMIWSPASEERYFSPLIILVDVLALGLVEIYDILLGLPLKPVKVPLDGIPVY